jgi:hypothetical protein
VKRCFKCQCEKSIDDFYRHARMRDGHLNKCKACTKADALKHRQLHLEQVRQYDRMRAIQPHRIALNVAVTAKWRAADPRRTAAHNAVARAIKSGALSRQPCAACGSTKVVAHHPDYDKPLAVEWLCQAHHKQAHAAEGLSL